MLAPSSKVADCIDYKVLKEFVITRKDLTNGGPFIKVIICEDHSLFITSQMGGQVSLYDLKFATKLSYLNQEGPIRQPVSQEICNQFNNISVTNEDNTPKAVLDKVDGGFGLSSGGTLVETDDTDDWPKVLEKREKEQAEKFHSNAFNQAHERGIQETSDIKQLKQIARMNKHQLRYTSNN